MKKRLVDADKIIEILYNSTFNSEEDYDMVIDVIDDAETETLTVNGSTSDGYHTFDELYEHRHRLFIALLHLQAVLDWKTWDEPSPWKSKKHSDGSEMEWWFLAWTKNLDWEMITYHLPVLLWDDVAIRELSLAPEWDWHTSADVLERLKYI